MINVTVINLRSVIKYLVVITILVVGISFTRFFYQNKKTSITTQIANVDLTSCLEETLPEIKQKDRTIEIQNRGSNLRRMLSVELPMMNKLIIEREEDEYIEVAQDELNKDQELAKTDVSTQEIQENNITPKYNLEYGTVKIKNESSKEITSDMLIPNVSLENNKDIVIFHTHTCESYTPTEKFNYEMTGSYRTTDLNYTVARVGTELENYLKEYGYNVIHDQTYHDYPAYSGSYNRSLLTVQNLLNTQTSAQMIIDLHRDAVRKQCKLCSKRKDRR